MTQEQTSTLQADDGAPTKPTVDFHGGAFGALLPWLAFLAGVGWLAWSGAPDERGFWPLLIGALAFGTLLARDRRAYCEAMVRGMSQPLVPLMILAWLLAGLLAQLLQASGFVGSVLWIADTIGLSGGGFVAASFLACCLVSTATGTSLGTLALCAPLLYGAGAELGTHPAMLMGAILGGATFGDNLSPVSDSTIASAGTQGAAIGSVVRSRLRYALPAAGAALLVYALGGGVGTDTVLSLDTSARALPLAAAPLAALAALMAGRHLVQGLLIGVAVALGIGLALDLIAPSDLISVTSGNYRAEGLLLDGLERGVGISIFTLLLMALVGGLEASGWLETWLTRFERRSASPPQAERSLFLAASTAVVATTHSVVALLAVGPVVRRLGERAGVGAVRRANLLDLTVCTYPFLLPYCIPTVFAANQTLGGANVPLAAWKIGLYNFHSWGLLVMALLAIGFGYGRGRSEG